MKLEDPWRGCTDWTRIVLGHWLARIGKPITTASLWRDELASYRAPSPAAPEESE